MKRYRTLTACLLLLMCLMTVSGCATLMQLPVAIVEGTFGLIGQILKLIGKLPKPPPGVF